MSKMRSVSDKKRKFIQKKYGKIQTFLKSGKVMTESQMSIEFKIDRTLVSNIITKIKIVKALSEDDKHKESLDIANGLPISFYKSLTPLKKESSQDIQDFFLSYGSLLARLKANRKNITAIIEIAQAYTTKRIKSYSEYLRMLESEEKKFLDTNLAYIHILEKKIETLEEEVEALKDMLALRDSDPDFYKGLIQQKLNMKK